MSLSQYIRQVLNECPSCNTEYTNELIERVFFSCESNAAKWRDIKCPNCKNKVNLFDKNQVEVIRKKYIDYIVKNDSDFCEKIKITVIQIANNTDVISICNNFIDLFPLPFWTCNTGYGEDGCITSDYYYLIGTTEFHIFKKSGYKGKNLLVHDHDKDVWLWTKSCEHIYISPHAESGLDENEFPKGQSHYITGLHREYLSKLAMLSQFLNEYIPNDIHEKLLVTYVLINKVLITKLSKEFTEILGDFFEDIEQLTLNDAVMLYHSIDKNTENTDILLGCFVHYLMEHRKFESDCNIVDGFQTVKLLLDNSTKNQEYEQFIFRLKTQKIKQSPKAYSIHDIDLMDGLEFEHFVSLLFKKMGYESEVTKASGDQGIDVIASKNGSSIGIQAKCYSGSVGNSAIQEVVAGRIHYKLDKALVVTNSLFTESAQQLAQSNSVILWDRNILKQKIDECF